MQNLSAQAQVMSDREAGKRLAGVRHARDATLPLMFFGTLEIGWLLPKDTLSWAAGCAAGHVKRAKPALLAAGTQQVCWYYGRSSSLHKCLRLHRGFLHLTAGALLRQSSFCGML